MSYIIIKGGSTHKGDNRKLSDFHIDTLHKRRQFLEENLRVGLLSKDKMNQLDCKSEAEEEKRVTEYDNWKSIITKTGKTNADNMEELHNINSEFKRRGKEGKIFTMDCLREKSKVRYE